MLRLTFYANILSFIDPNIMKFANQNLAVLKRFGFDHMRFVISEPQLYITNTAPPRWELSMLMKLRARSLRGSGAADSHIFIIASIFHFFNQILFPGHHHSCSKHQSYVAEKLCQSILVGKQSIFRVCLGEMRKP